MGSFFFRNLDLLLSEEAETEKQQKSKSFGTSKLKGRKNSPSSLSAVKNQLKRHNSVG
jgi:hypothetical protein